MAWLHVNNRCIGDVACLYQEGGTTGIMFCHQPGGLISGTGPITGILRYINKFNFSLYERKKERCISKRVYN